MGRHTREDGDHHHRDPVAAVSLDRVAAALRGLGFEPVARLDRVVVGLPSATVTAWVCYERPLTLVLDAVERIPTAFEASGELARLCNAWNRDQLGPVASCRLMDSGDFRVRLRSATAIRHGLNDAQLLTWLSRFCELVGAFSTQLRDRTLPIGFDSPLPPALMRQQDLEALVGELSLRDAPFEAPDAFIPTPAPSFPAPVTLHTLEETLRALDFTFATADGVIATGVNGLTFALMVDAGTHIRVAAMWDSGLDPDDAFFSTWLACNEVTDTTLGTALFVHEDLDTLHIQAETSRIVADGLSAPQRNDFVITAILHCLAAMDRVSVLVSGSTAVHWPR